MTTVLAGVFTFLAPVAAQTGNLAAVQPAHPSSAVDLKFSFVAETMPGYTRVTPETVYDAERGYGFDLGSKVFEKAGTGKEAGCISGQNGRAFFFSVKLTPGAYSVRVRLGGSAAPATTTVKSESRRLMLEAVPVKSGQTETRTFLVHLRVPQLPNGRMVRLKPREHEPILVMQWDEENSLNFTELDWDEKLTLEFSGESAAVQSVEIREAAQHSTVYLIGDSTVTDQAMEPWYGWGQLLPRWFQPPVLIANYAQSGETGVSFLGELRWAKLLTEIQAGDFVLMQFGINDWNNGIPLEQFKQAFVQFIEDTRRLGATPVLVTSQNIFRLNEQGKVMPTLEGYPDAMREVAREHGVALIDLNAMSLILYEAIGPENLPTVFVDEFHQTLYGSYELAKCVMREIIENNLSFAEWVTEDWAGFDPAYPDDPGSIHLPPDPQLDPRRPGVP